ncbi:MAG: hypothetical protein CL522_03860 [Actinobacteria bacterium]|nr:hypothetical protein [Actinomycetota bacterium]|tara:strand:- start:944 stop:1654 length:711 start_codon:yes stop_codon:yes gene_type:complete
MRHEKPSWSFQLEDGRKAYLIFTTKDQGDLSTSQDPQILASRQRSIVDEKWAYLTQVHGTEIVQVQSPGECQGRSGDAILTNSSGVPISIQVADCAPVALVSPLGSLNLVHAGWRGLTLGIIDRAVELMEGLGKEPAVAVIGPCIHPSVYQFGENEMKTICNVFGDSVRSETREGCLALNLPKAVEISLTQNGITEIVRIDECTSNPEKFWSHRLRKDRKRQAMVGWIGPRKGDFG